MSNEKDFSIQAKNLVFSSTRAILLVNQKHWWRRKPTKWMLHCHFFLTLEIQTLSSSGNDFDFFNSSYLLLFFQTKIKYIYIICRPGGAYWEKLCQRSWVRPEAAGRGPCSRPRAQFFSIRTDQGRQIIFLFFSCCFSKVKRVLLFSESNVLQARVKWTMKRSRLWHQSSKIRFFTLLKPRNHRKQYN